MSRLISRVAEEGLRPRTAARSTARCGPREANTTSARYCVNVTSPAAVSERAAIATSTRLAVISASTSSDSDLSPFVGLRTSAPTCAVAFRFLILGFTEFFTGTADYSDAGRAPHPVSTPLGPWFLWVVPVVGGLLDELLGPHRASRPRRGPRRSRSNARRRMRGGRIPVRVAVVKSLASALCIGSGGSVGR